MERGPNRYALYFWLEDTEGSPKLSYLLIRKENGYPTVQTDKQGRFRFGLVKLGEYVLT